MEKRKNLDLKGGMEGKNLQQIQAKSRSGGAAAIILGGDAGDVHRVRGDGTDRCDEIQGGRSGYFWLVATEQARLMNTWSCICIEYIKL